MRTISFQPGTIFYHGTSYPLFEVLADSSWVTDSEEDAEELASLHDGGDALRILTFETVSPINLILAETKADFQEALSELFIDYDRSVLGEESYILDPYGLADLICEEGSYDGWHTPNEYQNGGSDTLICKPSRHFKLINIEEWFA